MARYLWSIFYWTGGGAGGNVAAFFDTGEGKDGGCGMAEGGSVEETAQEPSR